MIFGHSTARRQPCTPESFCSWSLKGILERWKECWRLAALPGPNEAATVKKFKHTTSTSPIEEQEREYNPKAGMRGKNVQWVPCSPVVLDKMLDMAKVTPDDYVIDPGSGDGRIVIKVAKMGARALGIESNPKLVALSKLNAKKEGVGDRATFSVGDFFEADFSEATVITLFLRKDLNIELRPKILAMKPGTRVVSNIFDMGNWEADEVVEVEDDDYYFRNHTARLWIVPANIEGLWKLPQGELTISQTFQMIGGTIKAGGKTVPIEGKVTGNRIDFAAGERQYTGRVSGNRMTVETSDENPVRWAAEFSEEAPTKGRGFF